MTIFFQDLEELPGNVYHQDLTKNSFIPGFLLYQDVAREEKIKEEEIMDVGMFDSRYLKVFDAKYGGSDKVSDMLYDAQAVSSLFGKNNIYRNMERML